jgi:RNA polymerase sigma-70 factor (ECF subfamily)
LDSAVEGLRAGDPAAFRAVYEALAPAVLGYVRTRGSRDPEALTQEVFLTVFRRAGQLDGGEAGLRTFVFSVAHARVVDEFRQRARRPDTREYTIDEDPRVEPSAEESVQQVLDADRVMTLLDLLPDAQRDVISLRVVAGLSLEETAESIGRSVGAVKQLQRRGLLALRDLTEKGGVTE